MSALDTWVSDKLHDILGISDKYISQYLISLCRKSASSDGFIEKMKETGTVDIDANMLAFGKELWERIMPRKGKGVRSQYDPKKLDKAVTAVKSGVMSIRKASDHFEVPKSTIADRVSGRIQEGATPGKKPVFPLEVEDQVAGKIVEAGRMGFGITRAQLCFKMSRLAKALSLKTPFRNGVPGRDWFDGFRKRHSEIVFRMPTPLNNIRARMLNPDVTRKYFSALNETMTKLNLHTKPQLIWNIDETNVSLTHKPSKILAEMGQRNVPGRVGNCRDGVTVLACVNAAGGQIPPLVIIKGLTEKAVRAYNVKDGPPGTKYTYQKKAWMEDLLGISWFTDHFLKHCGIDRPQIIILDSHSSHETLGLIDSARENHIELFALPPHTTQYLNPLDKTVFGPFQREYDRQCSNFMSQSPNNLVTKWEWPRLFRDAYQKSVVPANIAKGFEVCGIYPFDPKKIPESAFAPSVPFELDGENVPNVATIERSESEEIVTPPNDEIQPVTLATADENGVATLFQIDDAESLLDLITTGKLEIISEDSSNPQEGDPSTSASIVSLVDEHLSSPIPSSSDSLIHDLSINSLEVSWNTEIDTIFKLEKSKSPPGQKKTNRKQIKSHRLLTSDEIYLKKKHEQEEKQRLEKEKEERKIQREQKKEENKKRKMSIDATNKKKLKVKK